jgi:hypothetical protein
MPMISISGHAGLLAGSVTNNISGVAFWWLIQRLSATTQHFSVRALSR